MRVPPPFPLLLVLAFWLAPAVLRAQAPAPGQPLAAALAAASAGDWTGAAAFAGQAGSPIAADIVLWLRLRDNIGSWSEYTEFLARHPDWPAQATLRRQAEAVMPHDLSPAEVTGFFGDDTPVTGNGALVLAGALAAQGQIGAARSTVSHAWIGLSLTGHEQSELLDRWGDTLKPFHAERLDMLLWRGLTSQAEAMLPLVGPNWRALGRARIAVRRDADGSTALIQAVPKQMQNDPGLGYERYLYRIKQGHLDEAEQWMLRYSASAASLGRPDFWMDRRANLARDALQQGDVKTAYRLAARNYGSQGADYAESEWTAGYIALTRMKDPERAIGHFERFRAAVFTPISIGRAGYWLGLAEERTGNIAAARKAFVEAAQQQTSFYGQLAAEHIGMHPDARLVGGSRAPEWSGQSFLKSSVVEAGRMLAQAGDDLHASQFLRQAAEGQPGPTRAAMAQMAIDIGCPQIGIRIAKDAAADGMLLPDQYYPLAAIAREQWAVPTELALAVARQESELNPRAVSGAGAQGLMQLMPSTASQVAADQGLSFDADRLVGDPMYNASLGTAYLAHMLDRYQGSYILAVAAYNAGPNRVDQWIASIGDPRGDGVDAVDWIEAIPFAETRNYVMRILEGMQIYRARLQGRLMPIQLAADIHRPGVRSDRPGLGLADAQPRLAQ